MSDEPVRTKVTIHDGSAEGMEVDFQEYFVKARHQVAVMGVRLCGVDSAQAAPGVIDAIRGCETVVICPSNPIVSIGPVLATGGIGEAVAKRRESTVAVSPIVAGQALKGPADRMLRELGCEPSVVGVARLWSPYAATLVIDDADAKLADKVEEHGMRAVICPTVMSGPEQAADLARVILDISTSMRTAPKQTDLSQLASAPSTGDFDGSWPR
jgi:LPPG:FO 2-phospho-L-lactate transferase